MRIQISFLLLLTIIANTLPVSAEEIMTTALPEKESLIEGEVIIQYKDLNEARENALEDNLVLTENLVVNNLAIVESRENETTEEIIEKLEDDPNVKFVQPNYQYELSEINTNDTFRTNLWGLDNSGQTVNTISGTADADIDAPESWAVSEGAGEIVVAVIDTGVAYNHPDLKDNMWDGTNCKNDSGAFIGSCIHGFDYEDNDKDPAPTNHSHGTHIAGTIAAVKNNSKGIIGVAPKAKIMAVKTSLSTSDNVKSINFAKQNGAKIINASWSGNGNDTVLKAAIDSFPGLFIAAAGNNAVNHNSSSVYPCDFSSANIICVAATNSKDFLASFSDFGTTSVDIAAPGTNIYSTIADSVHTLENFSSAIAPNLPTGWSKTGDAGTFDVGGSFGNVLYGDHLNIPYASNANNLITAPSFNLSAYTGAYLDFTATCDTEYITDGWADYMAIEYSSNGTSFTEYTRWDEAGLDSDTSSSGSATANFRNFPIPDEYITENFRFRLRWVTNATDNDHDGCFVDNLELNVLSDGLDELYGFSSGTSMATPHAVGLAALVWGYNQNLSFTQVKEILLETGDSLSGLSGKILSGKRINAFNALNIFQPTIQIDSLEKLTASAIQINFKIKDGKSNLPITLSHFEYTTDDGTTWKAPTNGDISQSLSANWTSNNYKTATTFSGAQYNFTINPQHPDLADLNNLNGNLKIRFKANDGAKTGDFTISEALIFDSIPPNPPTITSPSENVTINADNFVIKGTAEINDTIKIFKSETLITSQKLNANSFEISVPLTQNAGNFFTVFAEDEAENLSTAVTLPVILEDSSKVVIAPIKVDADTSAPFVTNNPAPEIEILGETGMLCRYSTQDLGYSAMTENLTVENDKAKTTLPDQLTDGQKTFYISCLDPIGNEQTADDNLDLTFILDRTAPTVSSITTSANPAKEGPLTVSVTFDPTGADQMDTTISPTVKIEGLKSPYTVEQVSYANNLWTGSITLLDEDESQTANISISGAKDIVGNEMLENLTAGSFSIDTTSPTAVTLSGTPQNPDTSAIPQISVTVSGDDIKKYKYKLDNGAFSEETDISVKISQIGLTNGEHTLSVIGKDSAGNWQSESSPTVFTWTVNDTTAPTISGLSDDNTPRIAKTWEWSSTDPTAQYKFQIGTIRETSISGNYTTSKTAIQPDGNGNFFLSIQSKDNNNNESTIFSFSAVLVNQSTNSGNTSSGGGGGGGGSATEDDNDNSSGSSGGETGVGNDEEIDLQETEVAEPFKDIQGHWAENFIDNLRLRGVISGKAEGKFDPDAQITRAELVKIVINLFAISVDENLPETSFTDVKNTDWYAPYVEAAKENNIVIGYSDKTFRPNQPISRVEALKILLEASELQVSGGEMDFSDTKKGEWYEKYVAFGKLKNLIIGYENGTFKPLNPITRAELSKIAIITVELE